VFKKKPPVQKKGGGEEGPPKKVFKVPQKNGAKNILGGSWGKYPAFRVCWMCSPTKRGGTYI